MMRRVGLIVVAASLLSGCADSSAPRGESRAEVQNLSIAGPESKVTAAPAQITPPAATGAATGGGMDDVVAYVRGEPVTMRQLVQPLIESHGLTVLLNLIQLRLARQDAERAKIVITDKDFADEHEATLEKLFKDSEESKVQIALDKAIKEHDDAKVKQLSEDLHAEREDFLVQFLANQHVDPIEFNIVLKINTYLRKLAEPQIAPQITDEALHSAFGQMYGERISIEYMQLANMQEVTDAQRRLANGDSFESVARDMSHDRLTAPEGGRVKEFSRQNPRIPENFKQVAFSLKDGAVSDVVAMGASYDIIKRLHVIPPSAVKFEPGPDGKGGMKDIVYKTLYASLLENAVKQLKKQLGEQAKIEMKIVDPILARQFEEKVEARTKADKKAREELDREQHRQDLLQPPSATEPTTRSTPGTTPATGAAPSAEAAAAGERPPAPQPGTTTLPAPSLPDTQPK